MAVVADALTTLVSAKLAFGVATADTGNDTLIEALIDAATGWIQDQCNRKFGRRDYNDGAGTHAVTSIPDEERFVFSGDGGRTVVLPNFPVDSASITIENLSSVSEAGVETWSSTGFVTNYDYVVDWNTGIITLKNDTFTIGDRNYRVTYEAGYEEPATPAAPWVPADLQRCCNEVVKNMFDGDKSRIASEKIGHWTRTYDTERDNPLIEPVIEKYKATSNLV